MAAEAPLILCCGEALIDMIPAPTQAGVDGFVPHPGGAVFNTAIALGRLGARVGMVTGLSSDMFGQQLAAALAASHVDTTRIITSDRPTTLAFVQLVGGQASYSFFDENSAGRMLSPDDLPPPARSVSALYFGGISLACEPGASAYQDLLARDGAKAAVMIDPNIRPGFITDEHRYRARLDEMMRRADIVKVSDEDLDWIAPSALSSQEKVDWLLDKGPALVIVTRGGDGATGHLPDGRAVSVPVPPVQVLDTVGAGDTFNAGVLARLATDGLLSKRALRALAPEALHAALAHGARVAGVTVSRAGANPPWAADL